MQPDSHSLHANLALCMLVLNDIDAALSSVSNALQYLPEWPIVRTPNDMCHQERRAQSNTTCADGGLLRGRETVLTPLLGEAGPCHSRPLPAGERQLYCSGLRVRQSGRLVGAARVHPVVSFRKHRGCRARSQSCHGGVAGRKQERKQ
jgi:hypothetical protein